MTAYKGHNLPGLIIKEMPAFKDERGYFREIYSQQKTTEHFGYNGSFVQINESLSQKGVLRGMHFQTPPHAQAKLVWVSSGAIWDVGVDLRYASPTYGKWQGVEISAANSRAIFIPQGLAHGFYTLGDNTVVNYLVSNFYAPASEGGIKWNDPMVAIEWPFEGRPIISGKDETLPALAELGRIFS